MKGRYTKKPARALLATFGRWFDPCPTFIFFPFYAICVKTPTFFTIIKFCRTYNDAPIQLNDSTSKPGFVLSASYLRNIRDAGIALVAFLSNVTRQPFPETPLAMTLTRSTHGLKILELGSGCGIVGLEIARLCPTSDVLLTDLPEAMAIMEYNVSKVEVSSPTGKIATAILDWDDALPAMIKQTQYNVVIVSDCTYNSDNIPALVKTLAAVVNKFPAALVVVSAKVRHDSEAIFFELMAGAGFVTVEEYAISLPDQQRGHTGQEFDVVNVFVFRKD